MAPERPERTREVLEGLPVDLLDGLRDNARTGRECDCPPYVSRCAHREGLRVWLITAEDSKAEYRRRMTDVLLDGENRICRGCGIPFDPDLRKSVAIVIGPGVMVAEYDCACRAPFELARGGFVSYVMVAEGVESTFNEAAALLAEVAP